MENSTSPDRYATVFSQEQQLSQFQARLNYATAESNVIGPNVLGITGMGTCGLGAIASLCVYLFACRACVDYKATLKKVDDVYECIEDPYVLNRLLNLAERYDLSLTRESPEGSTEEPKGIAVTALIQFLKDRQQEAKLRWTDRAGFSLWIQQNFEKAGLTVPMPELVKKIIQDKDCDVSPITQAPRPSA